MGWYVRLYGQEKATAFFLKAQEVRKNRKNANQYQKLKKAIESDIKAFDIAIKSQKSKIEKNYEDIKMKYQAFYDLLLEVVNPPFLEKLYERKSSRFRSGLLYVSGMHSNISSNIIYHIKWK